MAKQVTADFQPAFILIVVAMTLLSRPLTAEARPEIRNEKSKSGDQITISSPSDCFINLKCPRNLTLAQLNHEIVLHPTDSSLYICRGDNFLTDGEYENASKDFNKALKLDPKSALAHIGKSRTLRVLGTTSEIFAELEKARLNSSEENSAKALWESAFLHREMKDYAVALQEYKQLNKSKFNGNASRAYAKFQTGETLIRLGKIKEGMAYFNTATQLDPTIRLFEPRAQVHYVLKEYKLSIDDYTSAIKQILSPKPSLDFDDNLEHLPELYRQRAAAYKAMGRSDLQARDLHLAASAQKQTYNDAPFRSR